MKLLLRLILMKQQYNFSCGLILKIGLPTSTSKLNSKSGLPWSNEEYLYLFKRSLLPNYFRDMFTLASQIHSYNTRNSNLFYIPYCQTNLRKFSIRFQGPTFFNLLSREIQNSGSISLFGKRLKKFLLSSLN